MKAILEFPAPESCRECRLNSYHWPTYDFKPKKRANIKCVGFGWCGGGAKIFTVELNERAPFCPLKIVPEGKEAEND